MIALADGPVPFDPVRAQPGLCARAIRRREEARLDAELVRRFNAGDEDAFVEIVTRHRAQMFAIAFSVLHNRTDAEEIAQDALIRAHGGLARFRGDSALASWLHRIALNLSRNRYSYFSRRCRQSTVSLDSAFSDDNQCTIADLVAAPAPGPVGMAMAGEFSALVAVCMGQLGARAREILTLRNVQNHSYEQIAHELGLSVGTVKSRLARARERLRALLAETCPDFGADAQPVAWFDARPPPAGLAIICA
ncbi:MAG: RNA polymerase sigma factor [Opitutae bacterium]|nr:RNA polymerase sigma factor [Opitutae bacterium]